MRAQAFWASGGGLTSRLSVHRGFRALGPHYVYTHEYELALLHFWVEGGWGLGLWQARGVDSCK